MNRKRAIIITGPTAVGKTNFIEKIFDFFGGDIFLIISADSRQVYKYMDIGTAKPDRSFLSKFPHYLIDVVEPNQSFSAGDYMYKVKEVVSRYCKDKIPLFVGGTTFYIRLLMKGFVFGEHKDEALRKRLSDIERKKGKGYLYRLLMRIDPERAKELHPNDIYRIKRALEINLVSKMNYHNFISKKEKLFDEILVIGLIDERNKIYARISERVKKMIYDGLIDEVYNLLNIYGEVPLAFYKTIGYMEVVKFLQGDWTLEKMLYEIEKNTRHLAKEQLLWLKNEDAVLRFWCYEEQRIKEEIKKFIQKERV